MKTVRLHSGERAILSERPTFATTWLLSALTFGLYGFWRRRTWFVLTDRRLVVRRGLLLFRTERSIPTDRIQDATHERRGWIHHVRVSAAGGGLSVGTLSPMNRTQAETFTDAILHLVRSTSSFDSSVMHARPTMEVAAVAAGWFADPNDPDSLRFWDGAAWTSSTVQRPPMPPPPAAQ